MGFHPLRVWQFWQGMLRLPCGLRVVADDCGWPPGSFPPGKIARAITKCNRNVDPKVSPTTNKPMSTYKTEGPKQFS